jgi:hypothetical protein
MKSADYASSQYKEIHYGRQRSCNSAFIAGKGIMPVPGKICGLLLGELQLFPDSRQFFGFFFVNLCYKSIKQRFHGCGLITGQYALWTLAAPGAELFIFKGLPTVIKYSFLHPVIEDAVSAGRAGFSIPFCTHVTAP